MKNEFCPECHRVLKLKNVIDDKTAVFECPHCHVHKTYSYEEKTFPSNINKFNWGACFWWYFWGFWNGMSVLFLIYIFLNIFTAISSFVPLLLILILFLSLFSMYYFGKKGNKLSWEHKEWESIVSFEKHQNGWNLAGKIYGLFSLISILLLFILSIFQND